MADRRVALFEGAVLALPQPFLERTVLHAGYQVKRPRAELHSFACALAAVPVVAIISILPITGPGLRCNRSQHYRRQQPANPVVSDHRELPPAELTIE
jgi:hypothetical protein